MWVNYLDHAAVRAGGIDHETILDKLDSIVEFEGFFVYLIGASRALFAATDRAFIIIAVFVIVAFLPLSIDLSSFALFDMLTILVWCLSFVMANRAEGVFDLTTHRGANDILFFDAPSQLRIRFCVHSGNNHDAITTIIPPGMHHFTPSRFSISVVVICEDRDTHKASGCQLQLFLAEVVPVVIHLVSFDSETFDKQGVRV